MDRGHAAAGRAGAGERGLLAANVCVNTVGDALASGNSVYESDSDLDLVGAALPFGLKLTESLLAESPRHDGLLLTACRGFTMYSYASHTTRSG